MAFSSLTGNLLGPIISSKLMELELLWPPLIIASLCAPLGLIFIIFIPETLDLKRTADLNTPTRGQSFLQSIKSYLQQAVVWISKSSSILKSSTVTLILLTFLIQIPLVLARGQFFVQYISKRFEWKLVDTGYLLSLRGIISIFILLVVLPGLSKLHITWVSAPQKDLTLARYSAAFLILGSLLLAGPNISSVISGVIIITFGDGLGSLCRSLITTFIDAKYTSRLYTLIGIVETISMLYSGSALAWFFTLGMKQKGIWLGLPYWWLASMCVLVFIALCFVRVKQTPGELQISEPEPAISSED